MEPRIVAIVGATATGKTGLAEAVADRLGGEVVCADSRQVYRELEIGTGKPDATQRAARAHHLFDALELGRPASAGWYARAAGEVLAAVRARGRTPVLVGGSGLYLRAVTHGLFDEPPIDPGVRRALRAEFDERGPEAMHDRLAERDPAAAARLHPADRQRVLRALEVVEGTGRPLSWWHARGAPDRAGERWDIVRLTLDPGVLRQRIAARTRWMFANGLVDEARTLVERGLEPPLRALRAIGYDEALDLLAGSATREEAEARVNLRTGQLAKRQRTWFRHQLASTAIDAGAADPAELVARAIDSLARPA
jgi:tRNA dimethylallyltransferase